MSVVEDTDVAATCMICGDGRGEVFSLREIMYGTGERFDYLACGGCGTLRLASDIDDMGRYYPPGYYSFDDVRPRLRQRMEERLMVRLALRGLPHLRRHVPGWLSMIPGLALRSRVLDVGCGGGALLDQMADWGFTSLLGVDPFAEADISRPNGVRVRKAVLDAVDGTFDLVMMHHSLEHVPDPVHYLKAARRLLAPRGSLLVRIPVLGGHLWESYGVDWVQLDPPRHIHLFTESAFSRLAERLGFRVSGLRYDAYSFSLWGSEIVRRGLNLSSPGAPGQPGEPIFSAGEMLAFEREIASLNDGGRSDNACFVLQPAG